MGYTSRRGRRPQENAAKSSHSHIINDPIVCDFLTDCKLPTKASDVQLQNHLLFKIQDITKNPINHIIALDGGYSEIPIRKEFPSSTITFFQFGALVFSIADLNEINECVFIDPEDIEKLKNIERLKLSIPTKNVSYKSEGSLVDSVRRTIYEFFCNNPKGENLIKTLKWFLFKEYDEPISTWKLACCPNSAAENHPVTIERNRISSHNTVECDQCGETIYLTDVFRLHEAVDDEAGAGGILGYLATLVEQMILVHLIRLILNTKPTLLREILFIKDGPLAFFGQTANMHKPMRDLTNFLLDKHDLFLAGFEKSGPFVDHADEISKQLSPGDILFLDNDYIYHYIIPGKADQNKPYARSSYYGGKLIYKSKEDRIYVLTIPVNNENVVLNPKRKDYKNIDIILSNVEKLKCDMYDSALIPIALVNKLVSISNHPSSVILEKFAKVKLH
jgi:hypothetical protein